VCTGAFALGLVGWAFTYGLLTEPAVAWVTCASADPLLGGDLWSSIIAVIPLLLTFEGLC
jgi:hypothetical protein